MVKVKPRRHNELSHLSFPCPRLTLPDLFRPPLMSTLLGAGNKVRGIRFCGRHVVAQMTAKSKRAFIRRRPGTFRFTEIERFHDPHRAMLTGSIHNETGAKVAEPPNRYHVR